MSEHESEGLAPAPEPTPPAKPSRARTWGRRLLRVFVYGLLFVLCLLTLVVHFPLDPVAHRFGLPFARDLLKHEAIEVGEIDYYLLDGVVIRDVRVGPPEGYTEDVFTADRIKVRYDLLSYFSGTLKVREVVMENPRAFLEIVDGKPNVVALLEKLPPSEPKPEEPPAGEPPDLTVDLGHIGVRGLTLGFDDGVRRVEFGQVHVGISGSVNPQKGGRIHLGVRVEGTDAPGANLQVNVAEPEVRNATAVRTTVDIDVELGEKLADPKVALAVRHTLAIKKIEGMLDLPPATLTAAIDAKLDVGAQQATLERFSATLGEETVLALKAQVNDFAQQIFVLELEDAHIPLALVAPFALAVLPPETQLSMRGDAGIEKLVVRGSGHALLNGGLPEVDGRLYARGLSVEIDTGPEGREGGPLNLELPPIAATVNGLEAGLAFRFRPKAVGLDRAALVAAVQPEAGGIEGPGAAPMVRLDGEVTLGDVAAVGAQVDALRVKIDAAATLDGQTPVAAAFRVRTEIEGIEGFEAEVVGVRNTLGGSVDFVEGRPALAWVQVDADVERVRGFGADVAGPRMALKAEAKLGAEGPERAVVDLKAGLDRVRGFGADVAGPRLALNAEVDLGPDGPTRAEVDLSTGLRSVAYALPGMGMLTLADLDLGLTAVADPARGDVDLQRLQARVGDVLEASATATVRGQGNERLDADLRLDTLDVRALLARVPAGALPKGLKARGVLSGELAVRGKLPPPEVLAGLGRNPLAALRMPLGVTLDGRLKGVGASLPGVDVQGLDGHVRVAVGGGRLKVSAPKPLVIDRVEAGDGAIELERVALPVAVDLSARSVDARGGLKIGRFAMRQGEIAVRGDDFGVEGGAKLKAPLGRIIRGARFDLAALEGRAEITLGEMKIDQPGTPVALRGFAQTLGIDYAPGRQPEGGPAAPLGLWSRTRLGLMSLPSQKLAVRDLGLTGAIDVSGLTLAGLSTRDPIPRSKPNFVRIHGGFDEGGKLAIKAPGVPGDGWLTGNELAFDVRIDAPVLRYPPLDEKVFAQIDEVRIVKFEFRNTSLGPRLTARGEVGPLVYPTADVPFFDLRASAGIELDPKGVELAGGVRGGGALAFEGRLKHTQRDVVEIRGGLQATDFAMQLEQAAPPQRLPDGTLVFLTRKVKVDDFDADVPFVQRLDLTEVRKLAADPTALDALLADVSRLWKPRRRVRERARSPVHRALRFAARPPNLTAKRIRIDQHYDYQRAGETIDTADVPIVLDRLEVDLEYRDWVLDVRRFGVATLGGDIDGRLAAQVKAASPPDADLAMALDVTGLDVAKLGGAGGVRRRRGESTEVFFVADMNIGLADRDVDGVVHISKLSLAQLDALLSFVDPARRNDLIQEQRNLINSYTVREWAAPTVKYVHVEVQHSSLDLSTAFGGAWGVRHILNSVVDSLKVESIDVRQIIDDALSDRAARLAWRTPPKLGRAPEMGGGQ